MAGYVYKGCIHDTEPTRTEAEAVARGLRKKSRPSFMKPETAEKLAQAEKLFAEGASQNQVHKITGMSRATVRQYFPDKGWLK